jgi:hypothetical protein
MARQHASTPAARLSTSLSHQTLPTRYKGTCGNCTSRSFTAPTGDSGTRSHNDGMLAVDASSSIGMPFSPCQYNIRILSIQTASVMTHRGYLTVTYLVACDPDHDPSRSCSRVP